MSIAVKHSNIVKNDSKPDIATLLVALTRSLYRTMRSASPNCSFLEVKTLAIVHEQKNPSMKEISDELGISSPAATPIIDRLIESKDVIRSEDENDRRIVRIIITAQGRKTFEKNRNVIYDAINKKAGILSTKEQSELARILKKLHA